MTSSIAVCYSTASAHPSPCLHPQPLLQDDHVGTSRIASTPDDDPLQPLSVRLVGAVSHPIGLSRTSATPSSLSESLSPFNASKFTSSTPYTHSAAVCHRSVPWSCGVRPGFAFPLFSAPSMYVALDHGWANSLLGFLGALASA